MDQRILFQVAADARWAERQNRSRESSTYRGRSSVMRPSRRAARSGAGKVPGAIDVSRPTCSTSTARFRRLTRSANCWPTRPRGCPTSSWLRWRPAAVAANCYHSSGEMLISRAQNSAYDRRRPRRGRGTIPISPRFRAVLDMVKLDPAGEPHKADAYVFGNAVGEQVESPKKAWETLVLKAHGHTTRHSGRARSSQPHPGRSTGPSICTSTICTTKPAGGSLSVGCRSITSRRCADTRKPQRRARTSTSPHTISTTRCAGTSLRCRRLQRSLKPSIRPVATANQVKHRK